MIPGAVHPPAAPHSAAPAQSPLVALLARHAAAAAPHQAMGRPHGAQMQPPGAPMPIGAGGSPAGRFGHAPMMQPGQ